MPQFTIHLFNGYICGSMFGGFNRGKNGFGSYQLQLSACAAACLEAYHTLYYRQHKNNHSLTC